MCWRHCGTMPGTLNLCGGSAKKLLIEDGVCKGAVTDRGDIPRDDTLIATGGISYPVTGSDGSGCKLARQAGGTPLCRPSPALAALSAPDPACRRMMGLALRNVTLTLLCDGKPLFTEQGEALFTHFGLSSRWCCRPAPIEDITKHRYICEFDLKPALDEKTLYDRLTRDFAEQGSHSAQGALAKLFAQLNAPPWPLKSGALTRPPRPLRSPASRRWRLLRCASTGRCR